MYELRKNQFTICYSPHISHRSSLISFFSGAKERIGYKESGFSFLHTSTHPRPLKGVHEVQKLLSLLELKHMERPEIFLKDANLIEIKEKLKTFPPYIAIAPSSLWETKRMPIPKFIQLIQIILEKSKYKPVIIGSKSDISLANEILDIFGANVINMTGQTNLLELSYLISQSSAVISNDSSPIHIASAFNIPTVAIFGATIPDFGYTPLSEKHFISEVSLPCRPCGIHGGHVCPEKHFLCMKDQDILKLFKSLETLLQNDA